MVFAVNLIFSSAIAVVTNRTIVAFDYKEGSVAERLYMWDQCLGTFLENPITGIGSGSFARKVGELSQLFKFKLPSYYDPTTSFRAHSLIFGLIAETGIVGLSAYFCWIIAITISSLKVLRLGNVSSKDDIYAIVAALLILGVPIGDLIGEFSFVAPSNWLIAFVYGWLRYRLRNDQSKGYGNKI
jgi:O-antigen ligase